MRDPAGFVGMSSPTARRWRIVPTPWIPKGLFDALDNDLPQDDRKSALEVPIIAEFVRRAMCRPRWCPHNRNAADAMKNFKGAHSEPLFTSHWNVHIERRKIRVGWSCNSTKLELYDEKSERS